MCNLSGTLKTALLDFYNENGQILHFALGTGVVKIKHEGNLLCFTAIPISKMYSCPFCSVCFKTYEENLQLSILLCTF